MPKTTLFTKEADKKKTAPATAPTKGKHEEPDKPNSPEKEEPRKQRTGDRDVAVEETQKLAKAMSEAFRGITARMEETDKRIDGLEKRFDSLIEAFETLAKWQAEQADASAKAAQDAVRAGLSTMQRDVDSMARQMFMTPEESKERAKDAVILTEVCERSMAREDALTKRVKITQMLDNLRVD